MSSATPLPPRYALLIGIDRYLLLPERYHLNGCVRDVETLANVLRRHFDFPVGSIERLVEHAATREAILQALDRQLAQRRAGDVLVIFFSGHGSQVRDAAQPSGWCESIVPYDSGRGEGENRDICDFEIARWIAALERQGLSVTLIFDACFSGGVSRDDIRPQDGGSRDGGPRARTVERDPRPVQRPGGRPHPVDAARSGVDPEVVDRIPHVLISACGEDEVSWETQLGEGDTHQGALTFHLCRALTEAPPGASYRQIFPTVARGVTAERPDQHPKLEGPRHRRIFQPATPSETAGEGGWATVVERRGQWVTLDLGAIHGLDSGAAVSGSWRVVGRESSDPSDAPTLGTLRSERIGALTTRAEILVEQPVGVIVTDCRASDGRSAHTRYQDFLRVQNHDPASRLGGRLEIGLVRRSASGEWHDLTSREDEDPPVLAVGDRVAVTVEHHHDTPLWVYLFDLGLRGRIVQVFPPAGGGLRLVAGRRLVIGEEDDWPIVLGLPEGSLADTTRPLPTLEHFKVVATSREVDLSAVEQPGFDAPDSPPARRPRPSRQALAAIDWTCSVLSFRLTPTSRAR